MQKQVYLRFPSGLQIPASIALLVGIQELLVIAEKLVSNRGCFVVAGEVAHVGENVTSKVDVATPPVGLIILLVVHQAPSFGHLSVQSKDVQWRIVTAQAVAGSQENVLTIECCCQ